MSGKLSNEEEKARQERCPWHRTGYYTDYNAILGYYKVHSCLENCRGSSLLDIGCGDGFMTELLARRFSRVVGVDASGQHLAEARRRLPEVEFVESLIEELDTDERFDTVLMLDLLEHLRDPGLVLQKVASLLAPGGIVIVHVPNALALNRRIAARMGTLLHCEELSPFDIEIAGHRRSYTLASLTEEVQQAGLRVVQTGGVFLKMLSTAQMDWFLKNGLWVDGGFGWGRVGAEPRDWRAEFCRACYEVGKERPGDCNIIYACIEQQEQQL